MVRSCSTLLCAVAAAAFASGCVIDVQGQGETVHAENHFTVAGAPDVTLATFDGSIRVESWDRNEVQVAIEKRAASRDEAERLEVRTTQDGDRIRIEAPSPGPRAAMGWGSARTVSYTVRVPRRLQLAARTSDGSIAAADLEGTVELTSGDGSISADGVAGTIRARTGDGSVRIMAADGSVTVDTGDGSATIEGRFDELRAHSGDGSLRVTAAGGSAVKKDWTVTTGDGSISLHLPAGLEADIDAHSGDGRATVSGTGVTTISRSDDGGRLRARVGTGGGTLTIESGDGSIDVDVR